MARDEIDAALDEYPFLPDAAAAQFLRELETARGVVPEQIVSDEHVGSHGCEVAAHRVNRTFAHAARVQLPDRTERATERTPARGLDEPRRAMCETGVMLAPRGT